MLYRSTDARLGCGVDASLFETYLYRVRIAAVILGWLHFPIDDLV